jgi:hypothetical protein
VLGLAPFDRRRLGASGSDEVTVQLIPFHPGAASFERETHLYVLLETLE